MAGSTFAGPVSRPPQPSSTDPLLIGGRRLLKFLWTQNPFYLLSACFVLHGTSFLFQDSTAGNSWLLTVLTGAYILMLAAAALLIVRAWSVWDDARSILLILLLLFVQFALTFDDRLLQATANGAGVLLGGFLFCAAVSEALLLGLRIRLPALFRLPYHVMLALLFLYPLVLLPALRASDVGALLWRIFLFSPAVALAILFLLPAVRRGSAYVAENGTPWGWPWFPWTVFVVLGAGLCVRGYALSLSFDPVLALPKIAAMQLEAAFDWWFLVPIVLASAIVLLEIGIVERRARVQIAALSLPLLALAISFPGAISSVPQAEFLATFMQQFTSPVLLTVLAAAAFFALAAARGVRHADGALTLSLLVLSVVDGRTVDLSTLTAPQPLPFAAIALLQGTLGLRRRDSSRVLLAALCGIAAVRLGPLATLPGFVREFTTLQLMLLAILLVGVAFRDGFARWLQQIGAVLLVLACLVAASYPVETVPLIPEWTVPVYILLITALAFAWMRLVRNAAYFYAGLANLSVLMAGAVHEVYLHLRILPVWSALRSYLIGVALLVLALLVSGWKAGLVQRLLARLPRLRDT